MIGKRVRCDNCNKPFRMRLKEHNHGNSVIESYFTCRHCKYRYTTHITDQWAREEQKKIKSMNDELIKRKGRLKLHMDKLKESILDTQ